MGSLHRGFGMCSVFNIPNKHIGIDVFYIELYLAMWQHIKDDFYLVYLEALRQGSLHPDINKILIKLLPKGKHKDSISE